MSAIVVLVVLNRCAVSLAFYCLSHSLDVWATRVSDITVCSRRSETTTCTFDRRSEHIRLHLHQSAHIIHIRRRATSFGLDVLALFSSVRSCVTTSSSRSLRSCFPRHPLRARNCVPSPPDAHFFIFHFQAGFCLPCSVWLSVSLSLPDGDQALAQFSKTTTGNGP